MRWVVLALLLSPLAGAARAQQRPPVDVALSWSAPAGCPAQADVEADIARRLGRSLAADGPQLHAQAEVTTVDRGYALALVTELDGESGMRTLEAQRCDELASAAAVIVALIADPHADAGPAPPPPPPPPKPEPEPAADDAREDEDAADSAEVLEIEEPETPSTPIVVRGSVRADLLADFGSMPSLGVGPSLALGVRLDRTAIELSGQYLPSNDIDDRGRVLGAVQLWSVGLGLCHAFGARPAVGPCARVEYGRMSGSGDEVRIPQSDGGVFAAAFFGLRLDVALLQPLTLCAEIAAGLPIARTLFTVEGVGHVHEPAPLLGRVRTGAELRF